MAGDINALTQQLGEFFSVYLCASNILRNKDELKHPDSYDDAVFVKKVPKRLKTRNYNISVPFITVQCNRNMSQPANIASTAPPL